MTVQIAVQLERGRATSSLVDGLPDSTSAASALAVTEARYPYTSAPSTERVPGRELYRRRLKRVFDILFTIALSPVLVSVVLVLALAVMLDGHAPFYRQRRVGRDGRSFFMWKLRSMEPNADRVLDAYLASNPDAAREWDRTQKLKQDPRITPIGCLLRRASLDELPQFWNVLRGDMSLVGPRPMMPDQQKMYPGHAYFRMRPGITGPWQVEARNSISFSRRADYDDRYEREMGFWGDVRLLAATVGVVLTCKGL